MIRIYSTKPKPNQPIPPKSENMSWQDYDKMKNDMGRPTPISASAPLSGGGGGGGAGRTTFNMEKDFISSGKPLVGGTKKMMTQSLIRVKRNSASPQAKAAAKKLYKR
jgi:hypothetical protein